MHLLALIVGILVHLDHPTQPCNITVRVEQHTDGKQAIPASSTRLLVVTLNGLGQRVVDNKTHIWLVDTHSESDCCANHFAPVLANPSLLDIRPVGIREPGMI